MADVVRDDNIQHGIDDDPTSDAEKGATLGGIGGAVTGAIAGSVAGPGGAVIGAVIGGVAGAVASGAAVGAIDRIDNDNNISGVGDGVTTDANYVAPVSPGNGVPGVQTGGYDVDGTPDTRGIMEKTADAVTGDNIDDKTGKPVSYDNRTNWDPNVPSVGNGVPGVQTGGRLADGSMDSRGILEKTSDAITGDNWDDKQGKPVNAGSIDPLYANRTSPTDPAWNTTAAPGNGIPGVQTGGYAADGTPDTRGIMEKTADAVTGDNIDDKTGKRVP